MNDMTVSTTPIKAEDHWTAKGGGASCPVERCGDPKDTTGTILFVHGSWRRSPPSICKSQASPDLGDGLFAVSRF